MTTTTPTDYEAHATAFLARYGIEMTVKPTDSGKCPPFCDDVKHIHGDEYRVRFWRPMTGKRLVFSFWNSLNDSQAGKLPTAYDVLCCCGSDLGCPQDFTDFCGEYGFDEDSRKAHAMFRRCAAFAVKLNNFFEGEEMQADLQLIN